MATAYTAGVSHLDRSMKHTEYTAGKLDLSQRHKTIHSAGKINHASTAYLPHIPVRCSPAVLDGLQVFTHHGKGVQALHFLLSKPNSLLGISVTSKTNTHYECSPCALPCVFEISVFSSLFRGKISLFRPNPCNGECQMSNSTCGHIMCLSPRTGVLQFTYIDIDLHRHSQRCHKSVQICHGHKLIKLVRKDPLFQSVKPI